MRKVYDEFFRIQQHEKIGEKVIVVRMILTVISIVTCLIMMSLTAFAYFSCNVTSDSNRINTANFETKVSINVTSSNGESVTVNTSNYKFHWAELKANTKYFITLQHAEKSTAKTGFVIITADKCDNKYHTQQLGKDGNGNTEIISFTITPDNNTKITFVSHWGTSSCYDAYKYKGENEELYITQGENVELAVKVDSNSGKDEDDEQVIETTEQTVETTEPLTPEITVPETTEKSPETDETTVPETTGKDEPVETTRPLTPETTVPETTAKTPETEEMTTSVETTVSAPTGEDKILL